MRTITLELLRHGPSHNQLLSPLTPYLGLCENHAAVTLHVPFEHNQFLYRLRALGYRHTTESRVFQLNDTARVLADILSEIPGLAAESNKFDHDIDPLTHLRLIISASELALLPFELALSPNGLPGAGQHLLLQPQMPICLTREIRRVHGESMQWPKKPKILFISAAPKELGAQIPLEAHALVLRKAIDPWVKYFQPADEDKRRARVAEHLQLLPAASIKSIEDACALGQYTHIHILAHGVERTEGYDQRFMLALHDDRFPEKVEYVTGPQLATALRPSNRPDSKGVFRPAVVTLASCDSGNQGSVAGAGSSIAHALHEAGIPMVVAGQFPLSFEGSICLLECLYEGLLWGIDPRPLLYDLRRRLYSQFQENHDWASLTAYVSFPSDFEEQLQEIRIGQVMRSIDAAMNHADEAIRKLSKKNQNMPELAQTTDTDKQRLIKNAQKKIDKAKARLEKLLTIIPEKAWYIYALLASTEKREAEVKWWTKELAPNKEHTDSVLRPQRKLLMRSRDHYWDSFRLKTSKSWPAVQYLSLTLVLQRSPFYRKDTADNSVIGPEQPARDPKEIWSMAHVLCLNDLNHPEAKTRIDAVSNLIELYLISLLLDDPKLERLSERALDYTDTLVELAGREAFIVYSTRRQIQRYIEWFGTIATLGEPVKNLAQRIAARFPEEVEDRW